MRIKSILTEINQENLWLAIVIRVKPRLKRLPRKVYDKQDSIRIKPRFTKRVTKLFFTKQLQNLGKKFQRISL